MVTIKQALMDLSKSIMVEIDEYGEISTVDTICTEIVDLKILLEELQRYRDLEEQGLLLRLPCKVGDTVYRIRYKYSKCTAYGEYFDDYSCCGCEKECDSNKEYYVHEMVAPCVNWIVDYMYEFNEKWFLTKSEAEQALAKISNKEVPNEKCMSK